VTEPPTSRHPGLVPGSTGRHPQPREARTGRKRLSGPRNKSGVTVLFGLAVLAASPVSAQTTAPARYANTQLADPEREAEAKSLMVQVRCLTCEGQSVADSDADMAGDMRALIRERIEGGESAGQVRQWLIDRYGDQITYDPPMSALSAPLWLAPLALLALGIFVARTSFRRRRP
jgi:cytochrome c-type biogenesis protein CcmH